MQLFHIWVKQVCWVNLTHVVTIHESTLILT